MDDTILLFEDEGFRSLLPLTYTRPAADIRCGIFTLRERLHARYGSAPAVITRGYLADVFGWGVCRCNYSVVMCRCCWSIVVWSILIAWLRSTMHH
jgi:hypothetical protein